MGKLDIVRAGHPILRGVAQAIEPDELGSKPLSQLVRNMVEAMRRAPGVGLAAPQIGVAKRVIVLEDAERLMANLTPEQRAEKGRVPFALRTIVNPTLELVGEPDAVFFEGCLSVPGFSALVPRAKEVIVRGTDEKGNPVEWQASGWPARILQHEVDHLQGTLYIDRMLSRTFGVNDEVGSRWSSLSIAEVREKLRA
ncbi:MAG: peptide deformylase [Polyangiaceae bacterium]|nr:peptide deformylase [Polyangiaceae bacterium]